MSIILLCGAVNFIASQHLRLSQPLSGTLIAKGSEWLYWHVILAR
jgi:hypothetical protein